MILLSICWIFMFRFVGVEYVVDCGQQLSSWEKYLWRVWCRSMVQKHEICKANHSYDNGTESDNQIINHAYNGGIVVNM